MHNNNNFEQPLRVTFVAGMGDMRVMRIAYAAQSAGIKVQLIIERGEEHRNNVVRPDFFDSVFWIHNLFHNIDVVVVAINNFKSQLVHCFMQCNYNHAAVLLKLNCKLPIIGDAYDMVAVQYNLNSPVIQDWLRQSAEYEKIWYPIVDGICFRSPYKKFMTKQNIMPKQNAEIIHLPEPIMLPIQEKISKPNQSKKILLYLHRIHEHHIKKLEPIIDFFHGIEFYCIDLNNFKTKYKNKRIKFIPKMDYNNWILFLKQIDAYVLTPMIHADLFGYKDNLPDQFSNRFVDILNNNVKLVVPDSLRYAKNIFKKTNYAIVYEEDDFLSIESWKVLLKKVYNPTLPNMDYIGHIESGQKLKRFYQKICERTMGL